MTPLSPLDACYAQLLQVGFLVLRQAADSGDREWLEAELEALHNVPSLLGETKVERHRYYWQVERTAYLDWTEAPGRETARSRRRTYYDPVWAEMAPLLEELPAAPVGMETAGR